MTLRGREAALVVHQLQRAMKNDVVLGVASLAASFFVGGVFAAGAVVAATNIVKRWNEFNNNARSAPGHFLMKLQRAVRTADQRQN
jgi:hypothetical protein